MPKVKEEIQEKYQKHRKPTSKQERASPTSLSKSSIFPWFMWGTAVAFYFYQFILRVSPGAMADVLMHDLLLDAAFLGTLTSFYYYGYACSQVPLGLIIDKLGPRRPLSAACIFCALGCVVFASGDSVLAMSLGRLLIGISSAMGLIVCFKTATQWFPSHRLPMMISLTMLVGTIGGAGAGAPLSEIVDLIGWRTTIIYLSIMGLGLGCFVWLFKKDCPPVLEGKPLKKITVLESLKIIVSKPQTWLIGLYGCFMYIPLSGLADLWAIPYIQQAFGAERSVAASSVTLFYIGIAIGAPFWALISTKLKSHLKPMRFSALLTGVIFVLVVCLPSFQFSPVHVFISFGLRFEFTPLILSSIFFFMGGLFSAGQFMAFAVVASINPLNINATATGFNNMLCMLSGTAQLAIGLMLDWSWNGAQYGGLPLYQTVDYQIAIAFVPVFVGIAFILTFFIREKV